MSAAELKVQTNNLAGSRIAVTIEIPAERCKTSYEEALSRLSKSIKLPGFRQGKVPKQVILQQIGTTRIKATALEALLETAWREAINQESIEPLCEPDINGGFEAVLENFNASKELSVTLETDIAPAPKLKSTKGLEAEAEVISFDPGKVDELIEQSRKQLATLIPVEDRPAAKGDIAVVSFKGTYEDGNEIEGGSSDSMDIELEDGQMIPGFVEGIIGMEINKKKTVTCQFPKDYQEKSAQGKKAKFAITLKDLKTRELPKIDDEFAKQASDKSTIKELKDDLEKRLLEDIKNRNKSNRKEALINSLTEQLEVDLPKSLIDQEVRILVEQTAQKFAQQGMDVKSMFTPELVKSLMDSSQEDAKKSLRRKLALQALAEEEKIEVDQKELDAKLKEVKSELKNEKNIDPQRLHNAIREDLLEEKLIKWLEENNNVIEQKQIPSNKPKQTSKKSNPTKTKKEK